MKIALIVLGLLGVLSASPLNFDARDETDVEEFGTFIEPKPEIFPDFEEEEARVPETRPPRPSPPATYPNRARPPQVHHNIVTKQGPYAGRLVNVVFNERGTQETGQKNKIEYTINGVSRTIDDDFEEIGD